MEPTAYLTILTAIVAVWVAYRQYTIQRYRVRLDLFDRRLQLIDDTRRALELMEKHFRPQAKHRIEDEEYFEVIRLAYRRSLYLFNSNEQRYLKSLADKVGRYEMLGIDLEVESNSIKKAEINQGRAQIIDELRNVRKDHEKNFATFMTLNQL